MGSEALSSKHPDIWRACEKVVMSLVSAQTNMFAMKVM